MERTSGPGTGADGTSSEDEFSLRDIWNVLIRNWLLIGLTLGVVVGATVARVWRAIPVYQSVASIRIEEQQQDQVPVIEALRNMANRTEVETEMQVVRSRTLAEEVVDSLGLQVRVAEPRGLSRAAILRSLFVEPWAPPGLYVLDQQSDHSYTITEQVAGTEYGKVSTTTAAAIPGATFLLTDEASRYQQILVSVSSFRGAVAALQAATTVSRPNQTANIITVAYASADTQLVHEVPNRLARYFIARGRLYKKAQARSTVRFIETQLDTIRGKLNAAEEAVTAFKEGQQVVSLQAEATAQVTQLANLQAQRNQIESEREALQSLVDSIQKQARAADPTAPSPWVKLIYFPTLLTSSAVSEQLRSLNEANSQRSDLLQRRTLQDPDVQNLTQRIHDIETQLRSTALSYLQGLTSQVAGYDKTLSRFSTQLEAIPAKEVEQARLQRQSKALEDIYTLLNNRLQEARILEAQDDASVRIVDPAIRPPRPVRPRKFLDLLLGIVLGGMLGVGIAFLREYMDETVHTREDLQRASRGMPVLGMIPRIRAAGTNGRAPAGAKVGGMGELAARLVAVRDPRHPAAEAYRSLRTNLTFASPDKPLKTIVFTSALPQDGKSTTAANLTITLAQQGTKVLLVDADLRRGMLHSALGVEREPGLTTILTGQCGIADAIREINLGESGTLHFLPTGPYPPNPAEILGSQRMRALVVALTDRYDLIVMDSAPLAVVTDATVLGAEVDGVVLVARANSTERGALSFAVDQLRNVRASVLGCVLNDVDFRRDSRYPSRYGKYGLYYQNYYGDDRNGKQAKKGKKEKKGSKV